MNTYSKFLIKISKGRERFEVFPVFFFENMGLQINLINSII